MGALAIGDLESHEQSAGTFRAVDRGSGGCSVAGGRRELWTLLRQLGRWRVHPLWYGIALLGPVVMAALMALLGVAAGAPVRRTGAYTDWQAIGTFFLTTVIIVGLFEEVGWRGFVLPRLQRG